MHAFEASFVTKDAIHLVIIVGVCTGSNNVDQLKFGSVSEVNLTLFILSVLLVQLNNKMSVQ